jgi:hypothetical protein
MRCTRACEVRGGSPRDAAVLFGGAPEALVVGYVEVVLRSL